MKKLLFALLFAISAIVLVSCGSTPNTDEKTIDSTLIVKDSVAKPDSIIVKKDTIKVVKAVKPAVKK